MTDQIEIAASHSPVMLLTRAARAIGDEVTLWVRFPDGSVHEAHPVLGDWMGGTPDRPWPDVKLVDPDAKAPERKPGTKAERLYGYGARQTPNGRFGCVDGQMHSMPTSGPWVHFEDWLENEQALEKLAATAGSGVRRQGMEVEDEGLDVSWETIFWGVLAFAAGGIAVLLMGLLLHFVIEAWS